MLAGTTCTALRMQQPEATAILTFGVSNATAMYHLRSAPIRAWAGQSPAHQPVPPPVDILFGFKTRRKQNVGPRKDAGVTGLPVVGFLNSRNLRAAWGDRPAGRREEDRSTTQLATVDLRQSHPVCGDWMLLATSMIEVAAVVNARIPTGPKRLNGSPGSQPVSGDDERPDLSRLNLPFRNPDLRSDFDLIEKRDQIGGSQMHATTGGGLAEGQFVAGSMDVDVAAERINIPAAVPTRFESFEPEDAVGYCGVGQAQPGEADGAPSFENGSWRVKGADLAGDLVQAERGAV